MQIRNLNREDLPQLAALYHQFWNEDSDISAMQKKYEELKARDAYILLAAEIDGRVAGSVTGIVCDELYGSCCPFLVVENVIVDQSFRRKGVGHALMCALEQEAKKHGCSSMQLVTELSRRDACAFYESLGFSTDKKGFKKSLTFKGIFH